MLRVVTIASPRFRDNPLNSQVVSFRGNPGCAVQVVTAVSDLMEIEFNSQAGMPAVPGLVEAQVIEADIPNACGDFGEWVAVTA